MTSATCETPEPRSRSPSSRPSEDRAVLVVAASDQAAVEARLRPQLGVLLCVVPSRWTKAQLDEIRDYLRERHGQRQLLGSGPHHTDDGQARMTARAWRECCRRSPPGLTRFRTESWLLTHGSPLGSRPLPYQGRSSDPRHRLQRQVGQACRFVRE